MAKNNMTLEKFASKIKTKDFTEALFQYQLFISSNLNISKWLSINADRFILARRVSY